MTVASVLLWLTVGCAAPAPKPQFVYYPPRPSPPRVVHLKSFNGLGALAPKKPRFIDLIRGETGGSFAETPAGLAYRNGHLYVCDTELRVVHDWNLATGTAGKLGGSKEAELVQPVAVATDETGAVYVADTGRGRVVAVASTGELLRTFQPSSRQGWRPVAVAVAGGKLYVADAAGRAIDVFSVSDGRHVRTLGRAGSGPGEFYFPMGVATDRRGRLYVSDMMNARVQVFDASLSPVLEFGRPGNRYGDMGKPKQLAVAPDGTILIADAEFARVHLFNDRGALLLLVGGSRDGPGATPMPLGVAVAATWPERLNALIPPDFSADYLFFVSNTIGAKRLSLFAVGTAR